MYFSNPIFIEYHFGGEGLSLQHVLNRLNKYLTSTIALLVFSSSDTDTFLGFFSGGDASGGLVVISTMGCGR